MIEGSELKVLSSYYHYGLPWAKSAQREAMMLAIEELSLMVTQALECLQLYWFGVGDAFSGNLCLGKPYVPRTLPFSVKFWNPENYRARKLCSCDFSTGLSFLSSSWV